MTYLKTNLRTIGELERNACEVAWDAAAAYMDEMMMDGDGARELLHNNPYRAFGTEYCERCGIVEKRNGHTRDCDSITMRYAWGD